MEDLRKGKREYQCSSTNLSGYFRFIKKKKTTGENNGFGKEKCRFLGKQRLWETEKGLKNCGFEYGRFNR